MIEPAPLEVVRQGVEDGMYLRALAAGQPWGELRRWPGAAATVLAGRLAMALGAPRLGLSLHLRAARSNPADGEALYYRVRAVLGSRGPLEAWRLMREVSLPPDTAVEVRADWEALRATIATRFRDFDTAERFLRQAESLCPERPWICVERASVLEDQDRLEDALAAARRPLQAWPVFRPGVGAAAGLLRRLGRIDEAQALLSEASAQLESASLVGSLALLQLERQQPLEALRSLDRYEALSPLLEPAGRAWLAARRSDAHYSAGDIAAARACAEQAKGGFYSRIAERLAQDAPPSRKLLAVPFIQQRHLTCSPTALASLTAYFSRPVDHVALAAAIAYDGTPGYRERQWASENGWVTREFRLSQAAAQTLIDAETPFTLVTQYASSAHAQVVAGYDARRGVLFIRDPSDPRLNEVLLDALLLEQAAHGPRCLALLPADRAAELSGVALPDEAEYDAAHAIELRLLAHDRAGAQAIADREAARAPRHRLVLGNAWRLANYDGDRSEALAAIDGLLALVPGDPLLVLRRLDALLDLGRAEEAREQLAPKARAIGADPSFAIRYAEELSTDARHHREARRLLERALRLRAADGAGLSALANLLWTQGAREEGLELYRLAACSEIHNEEYVGRYVAEARLLGRAEEAVRFLRDRVAGLGDRSSAPVRSLFRGLEDLSRSEQAFEALREGIERHPADGDLLLFASEAEGRYGRLARARELLAASRGRAKEVRRKRTEAILFGFEANLRSSLDAWRFVAAAEPLSLDAHRKVAGLLARLEGPSAPQVYLEETLRRLPRHIGLHRLLVEWLRGDPSECEAALRELLARHPADAWARRELALRLADQGRFEAALDAVARAAEVEPNAASTHGVRGHVLAQGGDTEDAKRAFQAAVARSADYSSAIGGWLDVTPGALKQEVLRFVAAELIRQRGAEGWFTLQRRARGVLDPGETRRLLERGRDQCPDVWEVHSALSDEIKDEGDLEGAAAALARATERFSLVASLWIDRASVAGLRGDGKAEIALLETAAAMAPGWTRPLRALAAAHRRQGGNQAAIPVLRRAVAQSPGEAEMYGLLAEALQDVSGERSEIEPLLRRALAIDPAYSWAWERLAELAGPASAVGLARQIASERPDDPESLLALANRLDEPGDRDERLALLERIIAARPRFVEALDLRAKALGLSGRFDEALRACTPPGLPSPPVELLGRRAWVMFEAGRRLEAMAFLREVLESHPDYSWGARLLSDWVDDLGTDQEALEAANRYVRLAPDAAVAHARRGDARIRTGDREGGLVDLERAIALNPTYAFAAGRLFDELLEAARLDDARALLDKLAPHLTEEQRRCRMIRIDCARGDVGGAGQALTDELRAGRTPGATFRPAIHAIHRAFGYEALKQGAAGAGGAFACAAAAAMVEVLVERGARKAAWDLLDTLADRPEHALAACRAWLERSTHDAEDRRVGERLLRTGGRGVSDLLLAARTLEAGPADARLPLYEEVLRLHPQNLEARDMRASALSDLGRHAEAKKACRPLSDEKEAPSALRARRAWIEAAEGRKGEARRLMRELLQQNPVSAWAWERLLEWDFEEKGGTESYLEDARRHVDVFPGVPFAHGYLGDALRRLKRTGEAEAAFRRSLALDPGYEWGRLALADLLLEGARPSDALAILQVDAPSAAVRIRRIRAEIADRRIADAQASFAALLRWPDASEEACRQGRDAFTSAGRGEDLEEAFAALIGQPPVPGPAGGLWMQWLGASRDWKACARLLERLSAHRDARREALAWFVRSARDAKDARALARLVKREKEALVSDDFLWGLVGHAWNVVDVARVLPWMEDWRKRNAPSWVLNGLVIALRRRGRLEEARSASRAALAGDPDHVTHCHRAWLGIDTAIDGSVEEAESLLAAITYPPDGADFYRGLDRLAQAVLTMRRCAASGRATAFVQARRLLAEADAFAGGGQSVDFGPLRRRAVSTIGRLRGGFGWLWLLIA